MNTIFHNLTISISAKSAEEAYAILTDLLSKNGVSFTTDTFSTEDSQFHNSTESLFPKPGNYNDDD
jgi:hypothetical protein